MITTCAANIFTFKHFHLETHIVAIHCYSFAESEAMNSDITKQTQTRKKQTFLLLGV
jgi:hypothetical protein